MRKLILLAIIVAIILATNYKQPSNPIEPLVTQCSIDMANDSNLICD